MTPDQIPWLMLLLLGALHGINPGMGWLFAVALGLQEGRARAVWRALPPMALGHAIAMVGAVVVAGVLGLAIPASVLKWMVAATLLGFGVLRLRRHSHAGRIGMRVNARDLTLWSLLMASAHGAGIMVLPLLLKPMAQSACCTAHSSHAGAQLLGRTVTNAIAEPGDNNRGDPRREREPAAEPITSVRGVPAAPYIGLVAALVHTIGYLLVTGAIAAVVYQKLGLRMLRRLWVNLDAVWAGALILTAVLTAFL